MPLSAREAAAYLGINPKTLRQKLRRGLIRGHQRGVTWFVEKRDLDSYRDPGAATVEGAEKLEPSTVFLPAGNRSAPSGNFIPRGIPQAVDESPYVDGYESLARWSSWVPFSEAARVIPRVPGVYIARETLTRNVVYVGMAAERSGTGMRGRLAIYALGRGATSGLGEGAMDRALADAGWLHERLDEAERGMPMRAKVFARAAIDRADLQICWAETSDGHDAADLEIRVLESFSGQELWNRRR